MKRALPNEMESMYAADLVEIFDESKDLLPSWKTIQNYRRIRSSNLKLRKLIERKIDNGAWKLLWVPPSLPNYKAA